MSTSRGRLIAEITETLARAGELSGAMTHAAAAHIGVNATDLRCVQLLAQHGSLTAGELARLAGLTTASITGVVDRLEQAGLASREPDPADRRRVLVDLRQAAVREQVLPAFNPVVRRWRRALADYDEAALQVIAEFLGRAADALDAEVDQLRAARTAGPRPAG
jgi:DNA-binding MarR family transcriptional regulator